MLTPLPHAWNESWNGGAESPSVLGTVMALSCGIDELVRLANLRPRPRVAKFARNLR